MRRGERMAVDRRQPRSRGWKWKTSSPTLSLSLNMGKPSAKSQLTTPYKVPRGVFLETAPVIKHKGSLRNPTAKRSLETQNDLVQCGILDGTLGHKSELGKSSEIQISVEFS